MSTDAIRMDPNGAVGWRDIALDGLTCYHRCVEAILRGSGFAEDDVTDELGGAVTDLLGTDGRPFLRLRNSTTRWLIAAPGEDHWDELKSRLDQEIPVVVWPDRFWLADDCYQGRRHFHNHAILALRIDGNSLVVLDIDAEEHDGYARTMTITSDSKRAFTRLLDLPSIVRGESLDASSVRRIIADSAGPLARFAGAAEELTAAWAEGADRRLARATDLWVLGDIQPQLYLFARICQRFGHQELGTLGFATATQAKKISLFLAGLGQHKPRAPYDLCLDDLAALTRKLRDVAQSSGRFVKSLDESAALDDGHWLWQRLEALSRWHFGTGLGRGSIPGDAAARPW